MKTQNSMIHEKTQRMTLFAILAAVIIIMGFTPLGYLKLGAVEITFLTIPVVVCALLLGPWYGAAAGFIFGVTSLVQAVSGMSPFGLALFSINPFYTIILCIIPRVLIGLLSGLLFNLLKKFDKHYIWSTATTTTTGALINTLLFTLGFVAFFRNANLVSLGLDLSKMSLDKVILLLITTNAAIEIVVCAVVGAAIGKAVIHFMPKKN